ncbi:MAG: response regulator [bacterium]|nr:response regulator [bacterium]
MKAHILVVDDTRDNLRLLSSMLTGHGYKVRPVPDGRRAISSAQSRPPDLILLDIMMPDMDGYAVCGQLKADERTKEIPVIFLSALAETVDKVRAFRTGGIDYITKPFQAEEVLARVETHLNLRNAQKQLEEQNIRLHQEISERKRVEEDLKQAKESAEAAQKASEAANQAKSVFLSNMSHELRSPLTAIIGFAQVMLREGHTGSTPLPPEHQEHVDIIRRSGEHLLTLINQVLELSKIEAGRMTLDETIVDIYRLLADMEDMFRLRAQEKQVQFLVERSRQVPQYVRTDEVKLRQVLINLLNNAVKFTKKGEVKLKIAHLRVQIADEAPNISHLKPQTSHFKFSISDTGPGIAPEEIAGLFDAFVQTASGRQASEGTGLGLPISRKFVQLMGGDMQVKTEVGHGALFTFEIQMQAVEAGDIESELPPRRVLALEPGQPRYRILVADDRVTNRRLVVKLLAPFGFDLREAINGKEAVELCKTWKPHLIWMDMRMPVMNGYEATKRIRELESADSTSHTKIIALTASSFKEDRARILAHGCDDYLRKPFCEEELFKLMSTHIGVKFVYGDVERQKVQSEGQKTKETLTPEALAALPDEWVTNLKQGAEEVDVELLFSVIEQIRDRDATLADALARLAEDFEYDEILALIQQTK